MIFDHQLAWKNVDISALTVTNRIRAFVMLSIANGQHGDEHRKALDEWSIFCGRIQEFARHTSMVEA
jgi:hypothetical protein